MRDPTQRFSDRVENYIKYRPGYPAELYEYLRRAANLKPGDVIADIGSGTGISSLFFLERGHPVVGVEPNAEMRSAAERLLASYPEFVSRDGPAERIPLEDSSVDFVVAGQAFHWFEPIAARAEMARILKPGCQAAVIWNMRDVHGGAFQAEYEQLLLEFGTDFKQVDHQRNLTDARLAAFFAPQPMNKASFANAQRFDLAGLRGRLLSSSYAPDESSAVYAGMLAALAALFEKHRVDGRISFEYQTTVFHGRLEPAN